MSRLKVRTLKLAKLPYGKYTWIVTIIQEDDYRSVRAANGDKIAPLRKILDNAGSGFSRFQYIVNYRKNRVYTRVLLTHSMDVALLKLCHSELIGKIYKIDVVKREF